MRFSSKVTTCILRLRIFDSCVGARFIRLQLVRRPADWFLDDFTIECRGSRVADTVAAENSSETVFGATRRIIGGDGFVELRVKRLRRPSDRLDAHPARTSLTCW